ncbi:hypothetical protein FRB90_004598, partial [Tulasnella sp. 427]
MPKAASGSAAARESASALRRNQACRQCRKRKLKCDAQKPHCSTCVKQWNAQIAVPPPVGFSHPPQPLCMYDHMEGLGLTPLNADQVDDPKQRISLLENQIAELQQKLVSAQIESGVNPSEGSQPSSQQHSRSHSHSESQPSAPGQHISPPSNSGSPSNAFQWLSVPNSHAAIAGTNPTFQPTSHHPEFVDRTPTAYDSQHFQYQWPPRPPPPAIGSRPSSAASGGHATSSSTFANHDGSTNVVTMNRSGNSSRNFPGNVDMDLDGELNAAGKGVYDATGYSTEGFEVVHGGWNTDLPEPRLLTHLVALYFSRDACASRILHRPTFRVAMNLPPTHPDFPHPALLHAICASASRWTVATKSTRMTAKGERDRFAEFHAAKTRSYIDQTIATGQNIFSVLLASIVLSWWFYSEGRWVEVWSHAGFLTRVCIPLGHNASPYLAPPRNPTDLEQRRRAWWMCIMFDRIVSVGGWPHSIDERDVGTELPLRRVDFEAEIGIPSNPQDFAAEGLFTRHNNLYTDPYNLFLKACLLFGRVTDYNTRMVNLRNAPRSEPTFTSSSSHQQHPPGNPSLSDFKSDPRMAPGFRGLDKLVSEGFLASFPHDLKSCLGVVPQSGSGVEDVDGTALDTDLYMAHIVPHAATITLHNPYIDFSDPNCPSAHRCLRAAGLILNAFYLLKSTSFDIKRLHPFATICWYLAAVVLVQQCRRLIDIGDRQNEALVWGEINLLRQAMIEFGAVSPIGIRQEKLLQGLMTDITRLTSHSQPLNVSVPLYPFSRKSLYDPTFQPTVAEVVDASNKSNNMSGASSIERLLNRNSASQANQSHVPSHAAPLPAPVTYADDRGEMSMSTMGVGMELAGLSGLNVLGAPVERRRFAFTSTLDNVLNAFFTIDDNRPRDDAHKILREIEAEDPNKALRLIWNLPIHSQWIKAQLEPHLRLPSPRRKPERSKRRRITPPAHREAQDGPRFQISLRRPPLLSKGPHDPSRHSKHRVPGGEAAAQVESDRAHNGRTNIATAIALVMYADGALDELTKQLRTDVEVEDEGAKL